MRRGAALAALAGLVIGTAAVVHRIAPAPAAVAAKTAPPAKTAAARAEPAVAPLALPARPRVIVFAPHPDDETIGVGGLIARLSRAGAPLRVVFMTNGDGYERAVEQDLDVEHPSEADYLTFGAVRQREATAAVAHLGVSRREIRFLGFPDGGLGALWQLHWLRSHPYTSPYTGESSPPEPEGVGYDGQDLTSVVSRLLRDFRPSVVVMPHPYDTHPDHVNTAYFVTEALTSLQAEHVLPARVTVLTYLVHHGWWPATRGPDFDRMYPLATVPDTAWVETELAPAERDAKRAALEEYKTQLEVMNGFLRSFVTRNELFATVDGRVLERIASIH
ncbi:MAG TPA: PIG-L family deacetylase [Candidatus Binatia bacterium]|nr:PIG-L family deacetylase [Candidatus Binatia bacterium]